MGLRSYQRVFVPLRSTYLVRGMSLKTKEIGKILDGTNIKRVFVPLRSTYLVRGMSLKTIMKKFLKIFKNTCFRPLA